MVKIFEAYEKESEIRSWLSIKDNNYDFRTKHNYTILEDGIINVYGSVDISDKDLTEIPYQFGRVTGCFDCDDNLLSSLRHTPHELAGGLFYKNNVFLIKIGGCKYFHNWMNRTRNTPVGHFRDFFLEKELELIVENCDLFDRLDVFRIEDEAVVFSGRAFVAFLRKFKKGDDYNLDRIYTQVKNYGYEVDE
jgi:hypothetical protein